MDVAETMCCWVCYEGHHYAQFMFMLCQLFGSVSWACHGRWNCWATVFACCFQLDSWLNLYPWSCTVLHAKGTKSKKSCHAPNGCNSKSSFCWHTSCRDLHLHQPESNGFLTQKAMFRLEGIHRNTAQLGFSGCFSWLFVGPDRFNLASARSHPAGSANGRPDLKFTGSQEAASSPRNLKSKVRWKNNQQK